jgi:isovaleryl-CoA dehydrogenase
MADFDFALGENAEMIRETTYRFSTDKIAPLAAKIDAEDWFPRDELWTAMGDLGLHGITVAEEDGGLGLGYLEHVVAVEEVSRASALDRAVLWRAFEPVRQPDPPLGNPEQKAKYLPKLISGEHVGSLAMSEAGAGSDVVSMKLKADNVQGGFVLNGTKFWITNAPYADTLVVYAKTAPEADRAGSPPSSSKRHAGLQHRPEDRQDGHAGRLRPSWCSTIASFPKNKCHGAAAWRRRRADERPRL